MYQRYHLSLTQQALGAYFSPAALRVIQQANVDQDRLAGQIGHPEYHFDDSAIQEGQAYIDGQRQVVVERVAAGEALAAWQAFGRLVHAAQDFYAHTNYVRLWRERHPQAPADEIEPLEAAVLAQGGLVSGRNYLVLEAMAMLPGMRGVIEGLARRDAHLRLNLDGPERGALFVYVLAAAEKRTRWEYEAVMGRLSEKQGRLFHGVA